MVQVVGETERAHPQRVADPFAALSAIPKIVATPWNLEECFAELRQHSVFGFDTETTGLTDKDRFFSAIWACPSGVYYFNFQDYHDGTPVLARSGRFFELSQELFDNADVVYIQNAKFDMRMMWYEGVRFTRPNVRCVEVLGRVVRNDHLQYSLAVQAQRLGLEKDGGVEAYIKKHRLYTKHDVPGKDTKVKQPHFDRVPFAVISQYGFQDGILPLAIGKDHDAKIKACPYKERVADNECRLTPVCFDMERRGIFLNWGYTVAARDSEQCLLDAATTEWRAVSGEIRENTKAQFVRLFEAAGEVVPLTEKGNPSLTDDILEKFTTPLAKIEQKIRFHEKRIGTYYSSFLYHICQDGRIRADIRQAGTATGRFSYRDPNLQNLPKDEESQDTFVVRGCFQPSPGFVLYSLDYSQLEYRLMLDYAGEHRLIKEVISGADVHQAMADMVGISRSYAKTLNFAILYGSGIERIARMLDITHREARELKATYFGRLPKVGIFMDRVKQTAITRGYVRNWLGRHCYLSNPDFAYIMPNHLIQGGGADVIKKAMVMAHEGGVWNGGKSGLVLQVHDELDAEIHKDEVEKVYALQRFMESSYVPQNGMQLKVNISRSEVSLAKRDLREEKPQP